MIFDTFKMLRLAILFCIVSLALATPPVAKTREEIEEYQKFLEDSRTGDSSDPLESRMQENPNDDWENSGKFEGDIILDDSQIEDLVTGFASGRTAYIRPNTRWPGNVVVFEFGHNEFNVAQRDAIWQAIRHIEHYSCVRFRLRSPSDRNYVLLTGKSDGCYANVGYAANRGIHTMNLARNTPGHGCFTVGTIIHEWLHILGFYHMHSAYNRDNYIRINFNNIINGRAHNFDKYGTNIVTSYGLPYEHDSCMHYGPHAFSRNGQPTITPLRCARQMGQRVYATYYDWERLRRHYNCPRSRSYPGPNEITPGNFVSLEEEDQFSETPCEKMPPSAIEAEETPYVA